MVLKKDPEGPVYRLDDFFPVKPLIIKVKALAIAKHKKDLLKELKNPQVMKLRLPVDSCMLLEILFQEFLYQIDVLYVCRQYWRFAD